MKGTLFKNTLSHTLILQGPINTYTLEELDWDAHDVLMVMSLKKLRISSLYIFFKFSIINSL